MGKRIRKIKNIRLHREGTHILLYGATTTVIILSLLWFLFDNKIPFYFFLIVSITVYVIATNFFRCPIRRFEGDTENVVVAPADGRIVVIEEVEENTYFHDKRMMVSPSGTISG